MQVATSVDRRVLRAVHQQADDVSRSTTTTTTTTAMSQHTGVPVTVSHCRPCITARPRLNKLLLLLLLLPQMCDVTRAMRPAATHARPINEPVYSKPTEN